MTRLLVAGAFLLWVGTTILLTGVRRLSRPSMADRLRPYHPAAAAPPTRSLLAGGSLWEAVGPLAQAFGDRLASVFGVRDSVEVRLRRVHSPLTVAAFRTRQAAWCGAGLLAGVLVALAASLPAALAALVIVGAPLLAFLVLEQRLSDASARWQRQLLYELPVLSEQLAMLLAAGFSLGAAINRLAARGQGCGARDLAVVANRMAHGLTDRDALREWAEVAQLDAVHRLVGVLAMDSDTGDLERLVGVEARQARRDVHRKTLELIERRAEQVWVPVTVATLVPGVILIAVPFLAALHTFSNA